MHLLKQMKTVLLVLVLISIVACSESTPIETQIKQFIAEGVNAAEGGDSTTLKSMISRGYEDERGYKRIHIGKLLQMYLAQHKNMHLFHKVENIETLSSDKANVTILVAMANRDIDAEGILSGLHADLYRFELELIKDGEWAVTKSKWYPALASDFQ